MSGRPSQYLGKEDESRFWAEAERVVLAAHGRSASAREQGRLRDAAIAAVLAHGARPAEVCRLRTRDVRLPGECGDADPGLFIREGAGSARLVPWDLGRHHPISRYWESQKRGESRAEQGLFFAQHGGALSTRTVRRAVARLATRARLGRAVTPSILRQTAARGWLESGLSRREVHHLLGRRRRDRRYPMPPGPENALEPQRPRALDPAAARIVATGSYESFIGNSEAVGELVDYVAAALLTDPPLLPEALCLTGPPSTGKSELATLTAAALGIPDYHTSGTATGTVDELLAQILAFVKEKKAELHKLGSEGGRPVYLLPSMLLFIDEIHKTPSSVQEALLRLLDPVTERRRGEGRRLVLDARRLTVVAATTEWGRLIGPLRTRFHRLRLRRYSLAEVAEMVTSKHPEVSPDAAMTLAQWGRAVPRAALKLVKKYLYRRMTVTESVGDTLSVLQRREGFDELGLSNEHRRYLELLRSARGPVGLQRIALSLEEGEDEVRDTLEHALFEEGYAERTERGRRITEEGLSYLQHRRRG